jgi:hypothetical protein
MLILSMGQIIQRFNSKAEKWRNERRIGKITHDVKGGFILIDTPTGSQYDIGLDRISTPKEALAWLFHMTEKNWFTPTMTFDLIEVIKRTTHVNEYCNPEMWENTELPHVEG